MHWECTSWPRMWMGKTCTGSWKTIGASGFRCQSYHVLTSIAPAFHGMKLFIARRGLPATVFLMRFNLRMTSACDRNSASGSGSRHTLQRRRTRRWAMNARTELATRKGSTPISTRRIMICSKRPPR